MTGTGSMLTSARQWLAEGRATLVLALPIMSGLVGQMLMGLADTLMVGQVGTVPLAAAAFASNLSHIPMVGGMGLLAAVPVLTAHAFGSGRSAIAGEVLRHGLWIAVLTGTLAALSLGWIRSRVGWLQQPEEVVAEAQTYLLLLGASLLPLLVAHSLKQFCEALANPWPPTLILLGGVLLNVFLNWLFIFGHWGFPAMGLDGAGLATLIARILTALAIAWYLVRANALLKYLSARWLRPPAWRSLREQLGIGSPVAAQHLLEVGAFSFAAIMMGWIHAEAMAAHQIAITCAATTFIFALGFGMAVSIRVGHAWGAGDHRRLRHVGFSGLLLTGLMMSGFALLFILGGRTIADAFSNSPEVIAIAATMLLIAGFFQVFDGLQVVAMSALRGMGDVRVPALIAGLSYWMIALPVGYLLGFVLGHGPTGIWIGLAAGLGTAAITLIGRFRRHSWSYGRHRTSRQAAGNDSLAVPGFQPEP
jgi:multidrug resistance protein, MATE family